MSRRLANHNDDIKRLLDKGYAITEDSGYLIVRDIPYLDSERKLQFGAIVTKFNDIDGKRIVQEDHQIFFAGSHPHQVNGNRIPNLGGGDASIKLTQACDDVIVQRSFSNKPANGFPDFFEKIESYVTIISGPAAYLHGATPLTWRIEPDADSGSVFKMRDTHTSRAEIGDLAEKFKDDVIAIIGLGGTGVHVLDFIVKTPVKEIRGYDKDPFVVHNAFRSPGRFSEDELGKSKSDVYRLRYGSFRNGLIFENKFIDASSRQELEGVTFAFVCVDKGLSRAGIFDLLISMGIPFIDVGMGLRRQNGALNGLIRATYFSKEEAQNTRNLKLAVEEEMEKDLYHTNIQISELNALNASLAVIKFKQVRGFYSEDGGPFHFLMSIADLNVTPLLSSE
jgi:hypothetical protein